MVTRAPPRVRSWEEMETTTTRRQLITRGAALGAGLTVSAPLWRSLAHAAAYARPRGVHLSYTGATATTTTATWFTDGARNPGSVVEWGPCPDGMSARERLTAPFDVIDAGRASRTPGVDALTHEVTMAELAPGERVRYRVGRPGAWSPVRVFRTAPPAGSRPLTFAHVGDHGVTADSIATTRLLRAEQPDLVLFAGDIAYADGRQPVWDTWFGQNEDLLSGRQVMAAAGNHENKDFGGGAFKQRFAHPGAESFYGFDVANVAFVVATAGVFLADGKLLEELVALEQLLADAALRRAAGEVDFVCVMQHYPLWTNHESRGPLNPSLVLAEEHILQRHQIDLLLVGHDHFYERSAPMAYGQVINTPGLGRQGYVQVISGGAGKSLYDFVPEGAFQSWSVEHARRYHAVLYEVDGRTLTGRVVATDTPGGEELDRFTLAARPRLLLDPQPPRSREAVAADLVPALAELRGIGRRFGVCDLGIPDAR